MTMVSPFGPRTSLQLLSTGFDAIFPSSRVSYLVGELEQLIRRPELS
jgi:hypothetical protein